MTTVMILLVVGAVLLLLETVLPGMIAGIVGALCLMAAIVVAYDTEGVRVGSYVLLGVLLGLALGTMLWLKYFPDTRVARLFISEKTVGDLKADRPELVGATGTALTHLRPSGMALIQGRRVDVVTEGALIERGTAIKVIGVEGLRVVVRVCEEGIASQAEPGRAKG
jgi:membrane-bound serine protease (ClpP class)